MQSTSLIAQKDQMIYDSFYGFSNQDQQRQGSGFDQSKLEDNSQQFYYQGADKRKQLFSFDNNAEIEMIKNRVDDDQIDIQSGHKLDIFSTHNAIIYSELKSPTSEIQAINSSQGKQDRASKNRLTDPMGVIIQNRIISKMILNNNHLGVNDSFDERQSPFNNISNHNNNNSNKRGMNKQNIDSYGNIKGGGIRDDNSQTSNIMSQNVNISIMQGGLTNNNQSIFQLNGNNNNNMINNMNMHNQSGIINSINASTNNYANKSNNNEFTMVFKHMRKMNHVKQFFQKICRLSLTYNTKQLKDRHYTLINDLSYQYFQDSTGNQSNNQQIRWNLQSLIIQALPCIPVFNPETIYCVLWDILYGISVLIYLFFIPMNLSFSVECMPLTLTVLTIQIINMFLSLTKGFYQQGHLILDRQKIVFHYLKQNLFIDLLIICILYQYHNFCWIFFVKIRKLQAIVTRADNYFQIVRKYPTFYEISHLIISILLIGQITGCGFHLIAKLELESNSDTKTWLLVANLSQNEHWIHKYIASEYFAFITMITVGYGDIYPTTTTERIYVILMTLISSAVFGYVMNTIGSIFKHRAQIHSNIQKRKQDITSYMNDRNIDRSIQIKILKYLDYQSSIQKINHPKIEVLFQDIPKDLTSEIYQEYFGKFLNNNKILSLNFSKESLIELSLSIKERFLSPNEYLVQKGVQERKVYFLLYGSLDVVLDTPNRYPVLFDEIKTVGECIGLRNAFNENEYSYSIKSSENTSSQVCYFEMKDFQEILSRNQRDYEKYCEMKDEITFGQSNLDTKCVSCERYSHQVEDCPLIHNNISVANTVLRYNHTQKQERKNKFIRRLKNQTTHFKRNAGLIRFYAKQIRLNMSIEYFPDYQQFLDQIMGYEDEKFLIELPAFTQREGITTIQDDYEDDEGDDLPLEFNDILINFNNAPLLQNNRKTSEHSIQSYIDSLQQNNNNIPLVYSQMNAQEQIQHPSLLQQMHLTPQIFSTASQMKLPSFASQSFNPQLENIIESNTQQKESIKELTNKSLISGKRERGDSFQTNLKKAMSNAHPPTSSLPTRNKAMKKLTFKHIPQNNLPNPEVQEEVNQDYRMFFLKNFEMLKNYTKYYPKGNSDIVIKKYNAIQSQKKLQMFKSMRNPLNTPQIKKRLIQRRSVIPSQFRGLLN